jgi:hypothetical protein
VKLLILCHISDRYHLDEVIAGALEAKTKYAFRGELYIAHHYDIIRVSGEE